jgi:hypothetical protein|tara:strand:- start:314 stop:757 length:444 start_codon:yes stop_codon:yes gene_type:complete
VAHVRQLIRDNIVTAVTGLNTTGANVYRTQIYPLSHTNLPGICVYASAEDITVDTMTGTRGLQRNCDFIIEAFVRASTNYDNVMDTICAEIEAAMATDVTRGGRAKDCILVRNEFEYSDEGDKPMAMARLTYAVQYRTAINNATTAL